MARIILTKSKGFILRFPRFIPWFLIQWCIRSGIVFLNTFGWWLYEIKQESFHKFSTEYVAREIEKYSLKFIYGDKFTKVRDDIYAISGIFPASKASLLEGLFPKNGLSNSVFYWNKPIVNDCITSARVSMEIVRFDKKHV